MRPFCEGFRPSDDGQLRAGNPSWQFCGDQFSLNCLALRIGIVALLKICIVAAACSSPRQEEADRKSTMIGVKASLDRYYTQDVILLIPRIQFRFRAAKTFWHSPTYFPGVLSQSCDSKSNTVRQGVSHLLSLSANLGLTISER